ncbi:MAG TPA: hypothetical protein VFI92_15790 [Steroidobacteraceae bacterium]|nr:hypothetical protein [Steroidobacteraceae bacterium]
MKTWIDWVSRMAVGMLFQGGYVTSPTLLGVGRPAQAAGGARRKPDVRGDWRGPAIAAHGEKARALDAPPAVQC